MIYIIPFLSSLFYSSDVIWAKIALDQMPIFILSIIYAILSVIIYLINPIYINNYITDKNNKKNIYYAVIAIVIGTIIADILMWYSIQKTQKKYLPIVISIIHSSPILSLILLYLVYKEKLDYRSIIGIIIAVIGTIIAVIYNDKKNI